MKIADADILLVPGLGDIPAGHWLNRWREKMANARFVELPGRHAPVFKAWMDGLVEAVAEAQRPVVLVAHSLGVLTVAHAARHFEHGKVRGAFLVAPPDLGQTDPAPHCDITGFHPRPTGPLPFTARVVASRTDPSCAFDTAHKMASDWGAHFQDAGESGHIDLASGHGPWPDGLISFAYLMKTL
ncbi:RBBP9/YdeN family alpha/beta hydrolase [Stappia indica]|uniref:RBBP9/YdeN family alpha/beta hydrolase n=1 Tax=Stappia indica TaxID=538381 RepID=UPI001CD1EC56|nr:alpha/beta fold hydrolase [Stappia indica]MCA1299991.1 alpha/beta fold hydrolase [Stappia indica]